MDISKLPKLGASASAAANETPGNETPGETSPAAKVVPTDDPATPGGPGPVSPVMAGDLLTEFFIAGILGAIFIMLGQHFGGWLLHGGVYDTGVTWSAGPNAGQPVKYFDLEGGTAWLELGEWVLGVCLLIEAGISGIGFMIGRFGKVMGTACLLLGVIGAAANLLAIVMQIQAGFTQPIISMIALAVGVMTSLLHGRRLLT